VGIGWLSFLVRSVDDCNSRVILMSDDQLTVVFEAVDCYYCMDSEYVKRRYGTVGPGPAKRVYEKECPMCGDSDE